jgi:hypothetical protein
MLVLITIPTGLTGENPLAFSIPAADFHRRSLAIAFLVWHPFVRCPLVSIQSCSYSILGLSKKVLPYIILSISAISVQASLSQAG